MIKDFLQIMHIHGCFNFVRIFGVFLKLTVCLQLSGIDFTGGRFSQLHSTNMIPSQVL